MRPDTEAYWVRVRVTGAGSYHAAQALAWRLASENPGMEFEVGQEKVWGSFLRGDAPGGSNGTQELPGQANTPAQDYGVE